MAQPCKAAMAARLGLGHLLDDFEDSRRPSSLSPRFRRVPVDGLIWRPVEAETIYRQAPREKKGREPGLEWAGPVGPGRPAQAHFGPVWPRFAPRLLLAWSLVCVHLHVGLWRRFLHGLGLNPCHASFAVFWLSRWRLACWRFGPRVIWSHIHRVSWLVTGFMIFSGSAWWTYPESLLFNVNFLHKQQTPKSTCKCELVTTLVCLVAG
jgi:hypothetical protein